MNENIVAISFTPGKESSRTEVCMGYRIFLDAVAKNPASVGVEPGPSCCRAVSCNTQMDKLETLTSRTGFILTIPKPRVKRSGITSKCKRKVPNKCGLFM